MTTGRINQNAATVKVINRRQTVKVSTLNEREKVQANVFNGSKAPCPRRKPTSKDDQHKWEDHRP